jgi:hypothetical protein
MKVWHTGAKSINGKTMFFVFRDVDGKREVATDYIADFKTADIICDNMNRLEVER